VDLHTHVIPGVDDGAPDLESALETLRTLFDEGVTSVAATPHLNASNTAGTRRADTEGAWPGLVAAAREWIPGLVLYRGFEIQLDTPELDLSDPALRLAGSRFALVEFYAFSVPEHSADVLARIAGAGYVPIVAHPERYVGYERGFDVVRDWRAAGALLQLNSGSLLGGYGDFVRAIAQRFLGEGQIDLIASDNHARPERSHSLRAAWDHLVRHGLAEQARLLLAENPRRILQDEMPIAVGRVELRGRLLSRLARALKGGRR
jgi:protein-tyrosine phosphatase